MPMKDPPRPGDFIRTETIQPAGLSVTAAAATLQVSCSALSGSARIKSASVHFIRPPGFTPEVS
jgi:hypothetical protein